MSKIHQITYYPSKESLLNVRALAKQKDMKHSRVVEMIVSEYFDGKADGVEELRKEVDKVRRFIEKNGGEL